MSAFKKKHGVRVDHQPIDGEYDNGNQRYQQKEAIQGQHQPRKGPKMAGFSAGGFPVKTDAFLQLLEKFDEGKGGDDDGDEIKKRIGDDEVDDEHVGLSHSFEMAVTPEVVNGGRHGEGRVLQLVDLLRVTQHKLVVDPLKQ